jgi:UDP-glucose 4-epimerase
MKLLIIGSEGFIGSNATRFFKEKGYDVYTTDIILKVEPNYTVINPEFPDFGRLFYNKTYDVCINASGAANVQFSFQHAAMDYTLNVSNVYHILESIRQYNPLCKFVNFSSAAVYGNPQYLPIDEAHPVKPISPYGWHKYYSELICKEFFEYYKIPTLSLRVFSAYGPGLKKQLFWDLYQKAKSDNLIEIYGTGNESRDFIYIDDILMAIDLLIKKHVFEGSIINLANGEEVTISKAVKTFYDIISLKKKYSFTNQKKVGDPENWKADINYLILLGYKKSVSLKEGLRRYTEWLQEKK